VPVIFHNLAGYDPHLFITSLGNGNDYENITCIPTTDEKYISFSKYIYEKESNKSKKEILD